MEIATSWPMAHRAPFAGRNIRSTTGCGWPAQPSMPRRLWRCSASRAPRPARASPRTSRSASRDFPRTVQSDHTQSGGSRFEFRPMGNEVEGNGCLGYRENRASWNSRVRTTTSWSRIAGVTRISGRLSFCMVEGKRATPGAAPRSAWRNRAGMRSPWIYGVMAKATGPSSMPTRILPRTSCAWSPNCEVDRSSLVHRSEDLPRLLAQDRPAGALCRALVLVDIAPRSDPQGVERIIGFMEAGKAGFNSLEGAAEAVAGYVRERSRPRDINGLRKNLRQRDDGRWYWHWDPRFIDDARRAPNRPTALFEDAARRLDVPTLLIRGSKSDVLTEDGVEAFRHAVPHARFFDVLGAGHMVAGDRNDAFTGAILSFLGDMQDGGPTDGAPE